MNKITKERTKTKMMNETYFEIMVKRKGSPLVKGLHMASAVLTVIFMLIFMVGVLWGILPAAAFGIACYFLSLYGHIEYEYLYVDKELQIDRILGKSKRKQMENLNLMEMEILAPVQSHELDSYRRKNAKVLDYSSRMEGPERKKYMLVVNEKQVIFEPTEELIKTIQMFAARKVFTY